MDRSFITYIEPILTLKPEAITLPSNSRRQTLGQTGSVPYDSHPGTRHFGLLQWYVEELMRFGAVHWCRVAPAPPTSGERSERISAEERAHAQAAHDAGVAAWGKSVRAVPYDMVHPVHRGTSPGRTYIGK